MNRLWYFVEQPGGILKEVAAFILEDHQRLFPLIQQNVEEGGLSIERISQHSIEGTWISSEHALQQEAHGCGDFIFMGELRLMVQGEPQGVASGRRTGSQQQPHLPVGILNAVSLLGMDDSFSTSAAMAAIAGVALLAIPDGRGEAVIAWQCLVAFQAYEDLANGLAQRASIPAGV
jgi:hypothetical protein